VISALWIVVQVATFLIVMARTARLLAAREPAKHRR